MSVQEIDLGFDPDELREKYRVERDKRLRRDGSEQYQEMTGDFTHYVDDPHIGEKIEREPLTDEITERGIVANGELVELDCIIFATGFEVGTDYTRRSGYDLVGIGGLKLSDKWADGMRSLHGLHTRGFPNLFIISNAQAAFTTNFPHAMDEAAQHIGYIVNQCLSGNISTIEPSEEAEEAWVQEIISLARLSESFQASCTPGYYNNEGKPNPRSVQNASYGKGPNPFFKRMKAWREEGGMQGLELS
jgi:cyclohexanone monooxygenase